MQDERDRSRDALMNAIYTRTYPGEVLTRLEIARRHLIEARVVLMRECSRLPVFDTARYIVETTNALDYTLKELTKVVTTLPIGELPLRRKD